MVRPNVLCVLDGVGGCIRRLIDVGIMTKEFISHVAAQVDANGGVSDEVDLAGILDVANSSTIAKGSTTATVAQLTQDFKIKTCNLGDSGYLILRPADPTIEKVFRSTSQQHYFNCPYQTGNHSVKPPSAQGFSTSHDIQLNDIIILGTDGLWDNVFDDDIMSLV